MGVLLFRPWAAGCLLAYEAIDRMYRNVTSRTCKPSEGCWGTCGSTGGNGLPRRRPWRSEDPWTTGAGVTQVYLRKFKKNDGVLYVGKAQEKARPPSVKLQ